MWENLEKIYIYLFNPFSLFFYLLCLFALIIVARKIRHIVGIILFRVKADRKIEYYRDDVKDVLLYYGLIESLFGININFLSFMLINFVRNGWLKYERIDANKYIYTIGDEPTFNKGDFETEELYHIILYAAGSDYKLVPNELLEYLKSDVGQLRMYYIKSMIKGRSYQYLWDKKIIKNNALNKTICDAYDMCDLYSFSFNKKIVDEIRVVYGLYKFIRDYTLLNEKGIEVESYWEILFKYSVLFNINKNIKEMINQKYVDKMYKNIYDDTISKLLSMDVYNQNKYIDEIKKECEKHLSFSKKLYKEKFKMR